jgi:hypothetical protein
MKKYVLKKVEGMGDLWCYWSGELLLHKMIETTNVWQGYLSPVPQMDLANWPPRH